jgi:hypothetical protein
VLPNINRTELGLRSTGSIHSSLPAVAGGSTLLAKRSVPCRYRAFPAICLAVLITLSCQPAAAQSVAPLGTSGEIKRTPVERDVAAAAQRFGIPAAWISAVMSAESGGHEGAISPKGAMGLMQIMPRTWADLSQRYHLGSNPFDVNDNITAGAAYLRELHDRYGVPGFLAAYNAGPARWEDHVATGRPLPEETRSYLARLTPIVALGTDDDTTILTAVAKDWADGPLFSRPSTGSPADTKAATLRTLLQPPSNNPMQDWTALAPRSEGLFALMWRAGQPR